jgi:hypothetical protein
MNILDLLQAEQGAQRSPSMLGPIAAQNLTPGFRAPALLQAQMPQMRQPDNSGLASGMGMLGAALSTMGPKVGTGDTTPTAGTLPNMSVPPITPGTGPGQMMSTSAIDAAINPAVMQPMQGAGGDSFWQQMGRGLRNLGLFK